MNRDPFSQPITHALIRTEIARAAVADAMARGCTQGIKAAQERSKIATIALMRAGG